MGSGVFPYLFHVYLEKRSILILYLGETMNLPHIQCPLCRSKDWFSEEVLENKPVPEKFTCKCNNCGHEWVGGSPKLKDCETFDIIMFDDPNNLYIVFKTERLLFSLNGNGFRPFDAQSESPIEIIRKMGQNIGFNGGK